MTLLNLPVDVIEIYCNTVLLVDVASLSSTCQILWEIGREHIYKHLAAAAARSSWAGDRIACVGDYLWNDDIPANLLTAEEKEEIIGSGKKLLKVEDDEGEYDYNHEEKEEITLIGGLWFELRALQKQLASFRVGLVKERDTPSAAPLRSSVSRNLSRQQYVRGSALDDLKEDYDFMKDVGFADVVLARICISSESDITLVPPGPSGVWARDRFDVVPENLESLHEDAWVDVSDDR